MKYGIGIYLCLLALMLQNNCTAQQNTGKTLSIGLLASHYVLKDNGMSALVYQGYYPGIMLQFLNEGPQLDQKLSTRISVGRIRNEINNNTAEGQTFGLSYAALFKPGKFKDVQLGFGCILNNSLDLRRNTGYTNNQNYYEFGSSAGAAVKLSYRFGIADKEHKYLLNTVFSIPVITALTRSNSIHNRWNDFPSLSFKQYVNNIQLMSFNRYISLTWEAELKRTISRNNGLSLGYQWNYRQIKEANQLQSMVHSIVINYFFL